jgi:hypothetical protein
MARLATWQTVEAVQQNLPGWLGRKPGQRMIIDEPLPATNQLETM